MTHLSEAILHDTIGVTLCLQDTAVVSMLRDRVDFLVIDAAARPFATDMVQALIAAAGEKPVLVRVEDTAASTLQSYLNAGADGLILTGIHYAAEAEKAIAACLYPPEGTRAYRGLQHDKISLQALNDQLTIIVEVAHAQTVAQIEEICEVTGINGVLVSPSRLAVAMEKEFRVTDETVQQALRSIRQAATSYELPFGLEGEGFDYEADFTLPCSDMKLLGEAITASLTPGVEADELTADDEESHGLRLIARRE